MCKMLVVTQLNLINLKNVFLYEIGLIAIREVSPSFDEEQQYWRPYQPKHSPSLNIILTTICNLKGFCQIKCIHTYT